MKCHIAGISRGKSKMTKGECNCDWGLGIPLPPHTHIDKELIRRSDGVEFWMPKGQALPELGDEIVAEWPEVYIEVDWKAFAGKGALAVLGIQEVQCEACGGTGKRFIDKAKEEE